jgi:hypothetical protein
MPHRYHLIVLCNNIINNEDDSSSKYLVAKLYIDYYTGNETMPNNDIIYVKNRSGFIGFFRGKCIFLRELLENIDSNFKEFNDRRIHTCYNSVQ